MYHTFLIFVLCDDRTAYLILGQSYSVKTDKVILTYICYAFYDTSRIDLCEAVDIAQKLKWLNEKELQNAIFDDNEHTITLYANCFVIK